MSEFLMPSLGADMEAGTLVEWLKKPGDAVKHGDIVAVVETQKGAIEIECFEDGVFERSLIELGVKVPVGTPLAIIGAAGAAPLPAAAPSPATAAAAPKPAAPAAVAPVRVAPAAVPGGEVRASPAARRLAAERGIDLAGIAGTGPGGAIVSADVEHAAAAAPVAAKPAKRAGLDLGEMRKAIAAAMARSKREIPHYYLGHTIDFGAALDWLAALNAQREPNERILAAAVQLKAVALALKAYPEFNGFHDGTAFVPGPGIHLGTAIAIRGGGLAAPAIRDTDRLGLDDLMAALRDLVARTRAGRLRSSELSDATITVSNLGERGVEAIYGVIYPPQVALVGFGTPAPQPRVITAEDGTTEIAARPVFTASLAADHRVSDGHRGALFLMEIARLLQNPEAL